MAVNLGGRSLLTLGDLTEEEILSLLDLADLLKREKRAGVHRRRLKHKNIALIFLKPSCRTRMSFVVAAADEGAHLEIFGHEEIRFGIKESPRDVARVVGRLFDGLVFRGYEHDLVRTLADSAGIPVWNGLCDLYHPTQVLADLMTIREEVGALAGTAVCYVGDGRNNQARTLAIAAARLGIDLRILGPRELLPPRDELDHLLDGSAVEVLTTDDPDRALAGAQVVYGDVWVSMGEEHLAEKRSRLLRPYKVTHELVERTGRPDVIYLHCLPAFHDNETEFARQHPHIHEVDDDVFEGARSRVFDQAENRMHTAKALMVATVR